MNPQSDTQPGLASPQPSLEQGSTPDGVYYQQPNTTSPSPHAVVMPQALPGAVPVPVVGVPATEAPVAQAGPAAPVLGQDDDVDALDKQWVAKAKAVVANTKDDPYLQSHELSRVKADFLQARYGKESKVAEIKPV